MMLAAITFQGGDKISRLYTKVIQKNRSKYDPAIKAKKYTTDKTLSFILFF